jgi:hypothetical protein
MNSFWHNYRTFRGQMRGKPRAEVARSKEVLRAGPIGVFHTAIVAALPEISAALATKKNTTTKEASCLI